MQQKQCYQINTLCVLWKGHGLMCDTWNFRKAGHVLVGPHLGAYITCNSNLSALCTCM